MKAAVEEVLLSGHGLGKPWASGVTAVGTLRMRYLPANCQNPRRVNVHTLVQ